MKNLILACYLFISLFNPAQQTLAQQAERREYGKGYLE